MIKRSAGTGKFVVILVVMLALVVGAIEWSRRVGKVDLPTPLAEHQAARSFPRELRDASGDLLTIPSKPQRIVSQTLATDEILFAICPPERIIALSRLAEDDNYSNVAEEARRVPGRTTQGAEQILQLQPDLIFVASYSRAETVQLLKASGAPVFRFANFSSIADIKNNIRTVGHAIGNDTEAETVIRQMDESVAAIRARVPADRAPVRVMSFGKSGYTDGSQTTFDDMARIAGAINVSAQKGTESFAKISAEKIIEWEPDYIVTGANHGDFDSVRRNLLADPIIATSKAGRAGRIIVIDNRHFSTVSQYIVRGAEDLADALYGKRQ
jgi:iron complex transport system substrate-binding protein